MAAFYATMTARLIISPLVPNVIAAFEISKGAIGLALTGMWAAYAVMQLPAGILADRFGERTVVIAGIGLTTLACVLLYLSPGYRLFVASTLLIGVGAGLYFPAAAALLTRLYKNTGQVLGLHISGGDLAGLITPVAAATVALQFGWRTALIIGAAVGMPVLVLSIWRIRPTEPTRPGARMRDRIAPEELKRLLGNRRLLFSITLAISLAFTFQSVISFFPTYLIEFWGFGTGHANDLFAAIFALWVLFTPITGRLGDRFSRDGALGITTVSMATGISLTLLTEQVVLAYLGIALLGIGMSWGGVIAARIMDNLAVDDRTVGYGLVRSIYILIGSSGSVVTGVLADTSGWPAAYGLLVVLLGLAFGSILVNRAFKLGF
ncbi:MAG: MFS transporter [Halobacteriales archaeon]|nr:MFS transporter [Halobacteriales archaeon]